MPNVYISDDGNSLLFEDEKGKNSLKKALVASVNVVNTGVSIIMKGGQSFIIPKYSDEQNLGSTSADDLRNDIADLIYINCPIILLSQDSPPAYIGGEVYNQPITASGGTAPYTFAVTTGVLPDGLSLVDASPDDEVFINGIPTTFGESQAFTITATDANGCTGSKAYAIDVWGKFTNSTPVPATFITEYPVSVSGLPPVYGVGVALNSVEINSTTVDLSLGILALDSPGYEAEIYLAEILSGDNLIGTVIHDSASGYPPIGSGSAPYTGNWSENASFYEFSDFNGVTVNGDWIFYGINNGTINSVILIFKPI